MTRESRLYIWFGLLVVAIMLALADNSDRAQDQGVLKEQLRSARAAVKVADARYKAARDSLRLAETGIARADSAAAVAQRKADRARVSAEAAIARARDLAANAATTDSMLRAELVALSLETEGILAAAAEERAQHGRQLAARDFMIVLQKEALRLADSSIAARDVVIEVHETPKPAWWRRALTAIVRPTCAAGGGAVGALVGGVGGAAIGAAGGALMCRT